MAPRWSILSRVAVLNASAREVVFKIVYYGPGLGGKTSSLQHLHAATRPEHRGKMVSLATPGDRTLYFDFLPVRVPDVRGLGVRLQLFTVPGQVYYDATRKLVLTGVDAVVFVADSQRLRLEANLECLDNLRVNLREHGRELEALPHVFQYNKRDLPEVAPIEELERELNRHGAPAFPTVATTGEGIFEALEAIVRLTLRDFERRAPAETTHEAPELTATEGGIAEALRRVEQPGATHEPTPVPLPIHGGSGAHALGLPSRAPGEIAARALAGGPALGEAPSRDDELRARSLAAPPVEPMPALAAAPSPSGTAPVAFSFGPLWTPVERPLAEMAEAALAAGDLSAAVLAADRLVTGALAAVASRLGSSGEAPRDPAVVVLLLGLDGRRYAEFRSLVREVRGGRSVEARDALLAYAFALEVRLARSFA